MGRMAYLAECHWRQHRPTDYATIRDRVTFFQDLEDEAAHQIDELIPSLAGQEPVGETFGDKVGRYRTARLRAEEIVFREVLMPTPKEKLEHLPWDHTEDADLGGALADFSRFVDELRTGPAPE